MKIINIKDSSETGDCTMEVELTKEEIDFYVEYAINDIVEKGMKLHNKMFKNKKDDECKE